MYFLYHLFHQRTKDKTEGGLVRIPQDTALWPASWKSVEYKHVERGTKIPLSRHAPRSADFYETLKSRTSPEAFATGALSLEQLGNLLQLSYGEQNIESVARRLVPSGGARYPLEIYVLAWHIEGLAPGVYHYNIKEHQLEQYSWASFSKEDLDTYVVYPWVKSGAGLVVITSVFARSTQKYGSRGYRYALLEAGHVGQMIYLAAKYLGFNARALAGTNDEALETLLDVDGTHESIVYSLGIGA